MRSTEKNMGIGYSGSFSTGTDSAYPGGGKKKQAHTSTNYDKLKSGTTQPRPRDRDMLDYLCFLAKIGNLPRRAIGKMLKVSPSNVAKRAERGRDWADHFLTTDRTRPTEIPASQIEGFNIENVAG